MADINLADLLSEEEALPRLTRGKSSEDYDVLIDAMASGRVMSLQNVDEANKAKLSQKVRAAAAKAGFKVTVRYSKSANKIYFQKIGTINEDGSVDETTPTVAPVVEENKGTAKAKK